MNLNDRTACSLKVTGFFGNEMIELTMPVFVDELVRTVLTVHVRFEGRNEH